MKYLITLSPNAGGSEDLPLWWKEDGNGYTRDIAQAGIFTKEPSFPENHSSAVAVDAAVAMIDGVLLEFELQKERIRDRENALRSKRFDLTGARRPKVGVAVLEKGAVLELVRQDGGDGEG